jgi:site-specific DNA recombinase
MAERVCCSYQNVLSTQNRVCCLYRVSTTKQVDHDDQNQADIPVQRKACREFAEKMGWDILFEEQETGVSGFKVSANDRDKIQLIKEYAEQGKFDILLVFMFDRIGRRAEETPFVVEWFVKHGIQVWSVNEGEQRIDTHADRLMNYIRFWQADGESQKTSIRTKTALGQMVQEGRFRGGIAPYGYRLVPSGVFNKRKHEVYKLEIDDEEAKVVRMMYDMCVGSGYGRFKIANFLSEMGIKTRDGKNWHEATVGHILHNIMYTGVLRSGGTQSEVFQELQIITPEQFQLAQKLMEERANDCNALRTMPRNTRGQSLLSGNVFCGHCGGRLTLTTNGTVRVNAAGERVGRKRIRYVCYNKTRKRCDCDGQTGYTMHILDKMVTDVLHQVFDRMRSVDEDEIISRTHRSAMVSLKERLAAARTECAKATKEYESLKLEIIKAVQGESAFPMEILSELVNNARTKMLDADARLTELNAEMEESSHRIDAIKSDYRRIMEWSSIFDSSDMEVKKMIAGYIIKRVDVYSDYRLHIEFNMNFAQFELGLETPTEYKSEDYAS